MPDVFPDLPGHPDYLPLIEEVSTHLKVPATQAIPRPVRMMGARKSRQAWSWLWLSTPPLYLDGLKLDEPVPTVRYHCTLIIDIHDPWHNDPYYRYEVKIQGKNDLWITLESRNRKPITPDELRCGLELGQLLPSKRWVEAPDDGDQYSWDAIPARVMRDGKWFSS